MQSLKKNCGFKYDMKDLVNIPKYIRFELKNTEELSFMTMNSDAKIE